jgi:TonB family protein
MKTFLFLVILLSASLSVAQPKDTVAVDTFIDATQEPRMLDTLWKIIKYPIIARENGIEGRVNLDILISKTGMVEKVQPLPGSDSLFIDAAVTAIKQAHFSPALNLHKPVAVWWTIPVIFKLPH